MKPVEVENLIDRVIKSKGYGSDGGRGSGNAGDRILVKRSKEYTLELGLSVDIDDLRKHDENEAMRRIKAAIRDVINVVIADLQVDLQKE